MDTFSPAMQRPALLEFAAALGCRDSALRRDECVDWSLVGQFGHVYAFAARHFQFFIMGWSTKGWNRAKVDLAFAKLQNDGDDEGGFILDRLPTKAEASILRRWLGVAKKRTVSEEELSRLRSQGFSRAA